MRTVSEIYDEYRIPPWLRDHQLRVAAIGKFVCNHMGGIDEYPVIATGLFHDMGNILKVDLSPQGPLLHIINAAEIPEWRRIQDEYRAVYGDDEHAASLAIAKKIGLPEIIVQMIDTMRFSKTEWILKSASLEMKIIKYADLRVAPTGILSLDGRLAEARERYRGKAFDKGEEYTPESLHAIEEMCRQLERIVLEAAGIRAESISDAAAVPIIEELKKYSIS